MTRVSGAARVDRSTKRLLERLKPGEIAVVDHPDIDELAAEALVRARALAVLDCGEAATGRYPARGPGRLLNGGLVVVDRLGPGFLERVKDGDWLEVRGSAVFRGRQFLGRGRLLDDHLLRGILDQSAKSMPEHLDRFFRNTLERAEAEIRAVLDGPPEIALRTPIRGRQVLVVVRGRAYREDLRAILPYVREEKPVLLAVDGGADALMEHGLGPQVILGDMDSVSDMALRSGAELIVHAYTDGCAPGLGRLRAMGLEAQCLPCPGTSEDAALLLAYQQGARLIVVVGAHSDFLDFQEKGRRGMGSTLLVRMKVGPILVDAKGVSQLYQGRVKGRHLLEMVLAAALPLAALGASAPAFQNLVRLVLLRARLTLGF
ncbi:MAG: putative cytokinetic ring protein SteA [Bacillota bacterium]|jgi:uncharacterized membrane-anchored protein